jgi:SnoaL-like polyketide cyclase
LTVDELMDGWQAAWSGKGGRDSAQFGDVCAAGIQYEDPLTDAPLAGIGALSAHATRLWAGFPDARMERTGERLTDGRFLAAPCKVLGTHRAPLEGLPATNRFVVVHCVFYCELQHDLLLRVRAFYDVYEAATQLGVLPARGTLGEKALLMLRGFGLRRGGVAE